MKISCAPQLFDTFPTAAIHGVVFDHVSLFDEQAAGAWAQRAQASVQEHQLPPELIPEAAAIKEWRNAFQQFGLKPSKYRSSIEQLYRRALKGDLIKTPLPLVNLYCYVSLIQMVPMGGYDLRKTEGDIVVRRATPGEEFIPIGESHALNSKTGVVVYADDAGIICWAWNYRDSARTSLSAETQRAIFFADSASQASGARTAQAISLLSEALSSAGCSQLASFALDRQQSEVHIL
jgi:DNA/RNA-binding domain of Phe-tRNA-synthetase-like protein